MKEGSRNGAALSPRQLHERNLEGGLLLRNPKDMLSKALELSVCFHRVLILWGTWRDAPFLRPLKEGKNFFI